MVDACIPVGSGSGFLSGTLGFIDCQAQGIGQGGWQALSAPGSVGAAMVSAGLTLFVAIVGYRLLLGERMDVRDGVVAVAKVGVVVMLAASWPAFRTLIYDTTMHGPAELAATIGTPSALPGAGGGLVAQLQGLDDGMAELARLGAGRPPDAELDVGPTIPLNAEQQQAEMRRLQQLAQRPRWDPQRDAALIGNARAIFLAGTIGAFASLRLLAGLLIALAPLFLLFLLFDATRGIFEGWVRGLGGMIVAAAATSVVLGVELALVGPWLIGVVALRRAGVPTPGVPGELIALALVFAVVLAAVLIAAAKVVHGFRMPAAVRRLGERSGGLSLLREREQQAMRQAEASAVRSERSRTTEVAEAITAAQRREAVAGLPPATRLAQALAPRDEVRGGTARSRTDDDIAPSWSTAGRRRTGRRLSAGATRRDRRA